MKYYKAIEIIQNLEKHTEDEIDCAIYRMLQVPTINAVSKDNLRSIVKYLFDMIYEVDGEKHES